MHDFESRVRSFLGFALYAAGYKFRRTQGDMTNPPADSTQWDKQKKKLLAIGRVRNN